MSKVQPGIIAGWLQPNGTCYYVEDSHCEWAVRYLNYKLPPEKDPTFTGIGGAIEDKLFDKKWIKIHLNPSENKLSFYTINIQWKQLPRQERVWLYNVAMFRHAVTKTEIVPLNEARATPLKVQFENNDTYIDPEILREQQLALSCNKEPTILYSKILKTLLTERMSFKSLLAGSEEGRKERGKHDVKVKPMKVVTIDGNEAWTFKYKSSPSTTGNRWDGYIQFFKDDVSHKDNAEDLDCMVDCTCPDFRFRYAYNDAQAGVSRIGKHPDWKYGNDNNGQKWKPRSQGGVGDFGVGLCKHLCALADYLKTKIEPDAPEPEDPPVISTKPKLKTKITPTTPPTINAPKPDDGYSDSRTGSLQESYDRLFKNIDGFAKSNPQFDINYETDQD